MAGSITDWPDANRPVPGTQFVWSCDGISAEFPGIPLQLAGFRDGVYTDWDWQKPVLTTTLTAGRCDTLGLSRKG